MILLARIIASASENSWSQIHVFSPQELEKEQKYGHLLAVVSLSQEEITTDLAAFGKEIISRLQEEYYGQAITVSPLTHLKTTLEHLSEEFSLQEANFKLTLVTAIVLKNVLYLGLTGLGKIIILREERLATILSSDKAALLTASGFLKDNDTFVLGTNEFFQTLTTRTLFQALKNRPPKKAAEILTPLVHSQNQVSKKAAIIAQVKLLQPQKPHPTPQREPAERLPFELAEGPKRTFPSLKFLSKLKKPSFKLPYRLCQVKSTIHQTFTLLKKPFEKVEPIYLKAEKQKQKKTMISVGLGLLILLILSVGLGAFKRTASQKQEKFNSVLSQIEYNLKQGQELAEINPNLAQTRLEEALQILTTHKQDFAKEKDFQEKLTNLEEKISTLLQTVKREYSLNQLPLFLALGLVKKDLQIQDLALSDGQIFVLATDGTIVSLDSQSRASQILGKVENSQLITVDNEKIYLYSSEGIFQLVNSQKTKVIEPEEVDGQIIDFGHFTGSLYLLDQSRKEVFKFSAIESGFGRRRRWFSPGVELEQTPLAFSINGSLWVLSEGNQIEKFTQGNPEKFTLEGLNQEITQLVDLYTNADSQFLYLLEKNRLLVFNKEGQYQYQYQWQNETPEKVIVDEANKKIFLAKDEKIWELEVK